MADQSPPEDVQSTNAGNPEDTDAVSSAKSDAVSVQPDTIELPTRLRVHALAKILGVTSKQLLVTLGELGIEARSAQSSLSRDVAESVRDSVNGPTAPAPDASAAESPAPDASTDQQPEPASVEVPAETAPSVEVPAAEATLFTSAPTAEPEAAQPTATTFATPVFLQPAAAEPAAESADAPSEAPARRRRSRKAAPKDEAPSDNNAASDKATDEPATGESPVAENVSTVTSDTAAQDTAVSGAPVSESGASDASSDESGASSAADGSGDDDDQSQPRRRRRGRRGRGRGRGEQSSDDNSSDDNSTDEDSDDTDSETDSSTSASSSDGESTGVDESDDSDADETSGDDQPSSSGRRSRRSRSRGRGSDRQNATTDATTDGSDKQGEDSDDESESGAQDNFGDSDNGDSDNGDSDGDGSSRRRRRRRRRKTGAEAAAEAAASSEDDPPNTVVHEREPRNKSRAPRDEVQGISGSTRLEAKRQRRRDGRDAGRRRPPILTESEFLARRESVDRVMVVREKATPDHPLTTQVAVLEDGVLVEHFVTSSATASMVGNVYLGRVQNVLPSMEAAFIDIGRGRNGVLYAGEVNWDAAGLGGSARKIEQALKPGDQVLVQVSKDPVGHKGARLTTQLSLAGRFLVYVPGGSSTGISRKLPDTERKRLKEILRDIVPPEAGVIIRTAAEGVSEEELARDVTRLQAQWASIEERSANAETGKGVQPQTLYEEPDMLVKVIRDLFNEDFSKLVIEGDKAWTTTSNYVETVAPDMMERLQRYEANGSSVDVFAAHRIDEQLAKALDRKVWLPSGGTLVIDRTEAMTVVDVNTGKFTGSGGNLEETVTRNNIEAAEEVVRQMRLRDIGGMIVVDFIDMVLESNRDLVLRRLTEALGRDRTRHQVSEVTSLGLVQMTRKKLGTGLVEAFSTTCEHCQGRGIIVHPFPIDAKPDSDGGRPSSSRSDSNGSGNGSRRRRGKDAKSDGNDRSDNTERSTPNGQSGTTDGTDHPVVDPSIKRAHPVALAMAAHHDDVVADVSPAEVSQAPSGTAGDKDESVTVVSAEDVAVAAAANEDADVAQATVDSAQAHEPVPAAESVGDGGSADTGATQSSDDTPAQPEPVVATPRRGRRVARKAAAPTSAAPDAGVLMVVSATADADDGADAGSAGGDTVADSAPLTAAAEQPVEQVDVPTARPRRRRAAARPAGPPVDIDV
ncbi:translation initiation factor IF-2 N-terminal domain-containing protein [Rhodococcus fascians]|nr:translation initiation factor IF-2 N-terminal domain-containing protein [Rhodococcus fascians]MBY3825847.1 translation initiation factor IF-2 N-terminal domain-containing protein [Rhodococcus fascians]MBY3836309.1 translation initiation factor IF-2 N-terminal domain-containing protein [Rhodococcus fascians]MBY3866283.1 translation initiation factor IF-2 N-terminal domain-containing protein [Rhodococcus fascians]MBY3884991.1 translation initiation factor IF-2 N-terminal domain-containing prot